MDLSVTTKPKKGGAQPGAGRPSVKRKAVKISITLSPATYLTSRQLKGKVSAICEAAIIKAAMLKTI
jgi:hypothetical protein